MGNDTDHDAIHLRARGLVADRLRDLQEFGLPGSLQNQAAQPWAVSSVMTADSNQNGLSPLTVARCMVRRSGR
jgi:hypothetical protein